MVSFYDDLKIAFHSMTFSELKVCPSPLGVPCSFVVLNHFVCLFRWGYSTQETPSFAKSVAE